MSATVKETAAAIRKALRDSYPGTKFSVRMSHGTGHGWLSVSWSDGPTEDDVLDVTAAFQSSRFDGMDDGYHSTGVNHWSCCGVNTHRDISPEALESARRLVQYTTDGTPFIETDDNRPVVGRYPDDDADTVARYYMHRTSLAA